jgi:hypothetical protein
MNGNEKRYLLIVFIKWGERGEKGEWWRGQIQV